MRADGQPLLIAGLWESWRAPEGDGQEVLSMTMLTVNADHHRFMRQFHKPTDEKRMVVVLEPGQVADWLACGAREAGDFMRMAHEECLRLC